LEVSEVELHDVVIDFRETWTGTFTVFTTSITFSSLFFEYIDLICYKRGLAELVSLKADTQFIPPLNSRSKFRERSNDLVV